MKILENYTLSLISIFFIWTVKPAFHFDSSAGHRFRISTGKPIDDSSLVQSFYACNHQNMFWFFAGAAFGPSRERIGAGENCSQGLDRSEKKLNPTSFLEDSKDSSNWLINLLHTASGTLTKKLLQKAEQKIEEGSNKGIDYLNHRILNLRNKRK